MAEILYSVVTSTIVSGLATFFIQEYFKARVTRQHELEIAEFKHKLEGTTAERNIKLTKVFQDQAEMIAETYSRLVIMIDSIERYTLVIGTKESQAEKFKEMLTSIESLSSWYRRRQIYLPNEVQTKLEKFVNELHAQAMTFKFNVDGVGRLTEREREDWAKVIDYLQTEAVSVRKDLDSEFKKILGLIEAKA